MPAFRVKVFLIIISIVAVLVAASTAAGLHFAKWNESTLMTTLTENPAANTQKVIVTKVVVTMFQRGTNSKRRVSRAVS